jgi:glutamate/tyrosine decarboxylase-like PLP-dependent enzyme
VVLASEDAHYSVQKMAALFGLGADNVYAVAVDEIGRMRMSDLEAQVLRAKAEGAAPFMVLATAGTTVLGAFDPIEEVADLCEKHNMWLHVDAAWGGGALVSTLHKHKLQGIQRYRKLQSKIFWY